MSVMYSYDKADHSVIAFMLRGYVTGVKVLPEASIELTYSDKRKVVLATEIFNSGIELTFYPAPYPDMLTDVDPGDEDTEPSSAGR